MTTLGVVVSVVVTWWTRHRVILARPRTGDETRVVPLHRQPDWWSRGRSAPGRYGCTGHANRPHSRPCCCSSPALVNVRCGVVLDIADQLGSVISAVAAIVALAITIVGIGVKRKAKGSRRHPRDESGHPGGAPADDRNELSGVAHNEASDAHNIVQAHSIGNVYVPGSYPPSSGKEPIAVSSGTIRNRIPADGRYAEDVEKCPSELKIGITVEGRSNQAVILRSLQAVDIERVDPPSGCPSAPPRSDTPDLRNMIARELRGRYIHLSVGNDTDLHSIGNRLDLAVTRAHGANFPFTVSAGDPEEFWIFPRTWGKMLRFRLELSWSCLGEEERYVIDDEGSPFALYPEDGPGIF